MKKQNVSDDPIIGIDLGTTNSLVSYCDEGGPQIVRVANGEGELVGSLPSVVRINLGTGKAEEVGEEARRHSVEFPLQTILFSEAFDGAEFGRCEG